MTFFFQGAKDTGPPPVATYDISANFNVANQTFANDQQLGVSEGVQVGNMRTRRGHSVDDVQDVFSNMMRSGKQSATGYVPGPRSDNTFLREFGRLFLAMFKISAGGASVGHGWGISTSSSGVGYSNGQPAFFTNATTGRLRTSYTGVTAGAIDIETGFDGSVYHDFCILTGGHDVSQVPYKSGDDVNDFPAGASLFLKENGDTDWKLVYRFGVVGNGAGVNEYFGLTGNYTSGANSDIDNFRIPDTMRPDLVVPTFHEMAPAASTAFTHDADCLIHPLISTRPSSGVIEIRFRSDWAVTIDSGGTVVLLEDADGARTSRGSDSSAMLNGSDMLVMCDDEQIRVHCNNVYGINYTSAAANKTATSGEVNSLGTGGAVAWIVGHPRGTGGEYSDLDNYPGAP